MHSGTNLETSAQSSRTTTETLPQRTPGEALVQALAGYPAMQLWRELRQLLPADAPARMYEAAPRSVRRSR